jgi:SAM-dependent methyltransferase
LHDRLAVRVYRSRLATIFYRSAAATPAEAKVLAVHSANVDDRDVLDIGVGTGRTTAFLASRASRYEGIDYSTAMLETCRKAHPDTSVRLADMRDLGCFPDANFDFLLASNNVLDAVSHEDRLVALREWHRVLRPGAILAFSTHNRNWQHAGHGPVLRRSRNPIRQLLEAGAYVLGVLNHRRIGPLRAETPDYAVFNDAGHQFALLHYYVERSTQCVQLARIGFEVTEVIDERGDVLEEGRSDAHSASLMYVARRV